jgi:Protein of unknown function (DUF3592)
MGIKLIWFGCIVLLGGFVTLVLAYQEQQKETLRKNWPFVPGLVTHCEIVKTTIARLRVPAVGSSPSPDPEYIRYPVWAIQVAYTYRVGDKEFVGSEATSALLTEPADRNTGASDHLKKIAAQINSRPSRDVHYDPADSSESYLVFVEQPSRRGLWRMGVGCLAVGVILLAGGWQIR